MRSDPKTRLPVGHAIVDKNRNRLRYKLLSRDLIVYLMFVFERSLGEMTQQQIMDLVSSVRETRFLGTREFNEQIPWSCLIADTGKSEFPWLTRFGKNRFRLTSSGRAHGKFIFDKIGDSAANQAILNVFGVDLSESVLTTLSKLRRMLREILKP